MAVIILIPSIDSIPLKPSFAKRLVILTKIIIAVIVTIAELKANNQVDILLDFQDN